MIETRLLNPYARKGAGVARKDCSAFSPTVKRRCNCWAPPCCVAASDRILSSGHGTAINGCWLPDRIPQDTPAKSAKSKLMSISRVHRRTEGSPCAT
jgi:hypothetical protein